MAQPVKPINHLLKAPILQLEVQCLTQENQQGITLEQWPSHSCHVQVLDHYEPLLL